MRPLGFLLALALVISATPAQALEKLAPSAIPKVFQNLSDSKFLADPSMIVVDAMTGEIIFERNSTQARKPASVIKLLSATSVLSYIDSQKVFNTNIYKGVDPGTIVINGEYDPWISMIQSQAEKMGRTSLPRLGFNTINRYNELTQSNAKRLKILYTGLFPQDLANLQAFLKKRGIRTTAEKITAEDALLQSAEPLVLSASPTLETMVKWTLLWSDNVLAERLARLAAITSGETFNTQGVADTFHTVLTNFGIDPDKIEVADGSGLSKQNRVTAKAIADLLMKIRNDPKYVSVYEGLPIGGVSGTLQKRFLTTAPQAVGLVRGKTGTLSGTVSLAGYVDSEDRQYIFVAIADKIPRRYSASERARDTLDRILGKIAAPIFPELLPVTTT
ncbi:D-alanyl-D-alanine carboxypeptidase / D-alanyl-D-alanine-endopeptidase (penicillin-binding protein 4) [Candidatus Planktophila limnetica]|uniref:D-alanyl-D-alanine carboxypeptidase / D-alanyl-D-alanine-endopeptidase (Penicillin-binding protein 4) n=1 Tax=Candidatus Planktophila limnetica TaxID=573600 RepID=A0A249LH62_9ACTN|nr:D-alanyl-D-alanine carboxypeptidase / D-alanyl-D-alanine-endopeptidase (penicillin-binding protein 4) [Candidatus Planktophila limnetica]